MLEQWDTVLQGDDHLAERGIVERMMSESTYWLAQAREEFPVKVYQTEKEQIISQLWGIVFRAIGSIDDAGCDWFTVGNQTCISTLEWVVSDEPEVAHIINAINVLNGSPEFIYRSRADAAADGK